MTARTVTLEFALIEAAHLADLVTQFDELLTTPQATGDPAVARLVPDAYRDDDESAREFRRLTEGDLLARRRADAQIVAESLGRDGRALQPDELGSHGMTTPILLSLSVAEAAAWLRTLSALRLVLASRLGIRTEDDHDEDDPRFGVYDWLGYRLDGLVRALQD